MDVSWKALTTLRRVTSDGLYIAEIDGLRFVAIASVLLMHIARMSIISGFPAAIASGAPGTFGRLAWNMLLHGDRGVEIFFAISGMVVGLPFARHRLQSGPAVKGKPYFLRRLTRLEPPYIANLLLRLPVVARLKHYSLMQAGTHFAVSVFYADRFVYGTMPELHPPSWSLAVEVQFYLLAPLLAVAVFHSNAWLRRSVSVALILLASIYAAHAPSPKLGDGFHLSLINFAQMFLAGMLATDFYLTIQPRLRRSFLWDIAGIPLWFAVFAVPDSVAPYLLPWLLLALIPAAFLGRMLGRFFRTPVIAVIGGMCYSLYLTHSVVLEAGYTFCGKFLHRATFWHTFVLSATLELPIILTVGMVFYGLIERPCMNKNWPRDLHEWYRHHKTKAPGAEPERGA